MKKIFLFFLIIGATVQAQNTKISQMPLLGNPTGSYVPVIKLGVNYKVLADSFAFGTSSGSGISSLNGLTGAIQTFAIGTSGTNFNIVSSGTSHTFNFPNASATNRGLLSTTDWSNFNSKQSALGFTPENLANKVVDFSLIDDDKYPSVKAVRTFVLSNLPGQNGNVLDYFGGDYVYHPLSGVNVSTFINNAGYSINFIRTSVKTSNYTAAVNDLVPVNTTSGSVIITLPNAPADKSRVAIKHIIQGATNTVIINCTGSDVFNKTAGSTSITLSLLAQGVILQYDAANAIWTVLSDDLPLSQLDARYVAAYTSQSANIFLASPNGSPGTPGFRSIVAADIPTLNQNTTGSAATLGTARNIYGNSFNGSADVTGIITSTYLPSATVYNNQANTFSAGNKQTFTANGTNAGFNLSAVTSDPSSLATGDLWYRSDISKFKYYDGITARFLVAEALAQPLTNKDLTSGTNTFPTFNQNTTGTAANLSGTPALPNGTTATTQTAGDNSTKLSTTAYVATALTNARPLTASIGSDVTTSSSTMSDVTGYSITIPSAGKWHLKFYAQISCSSTSGVKLGLNVTGGTVTLYSGGFILGNLTGSSSNRLLAITAVNGTSTGIYNTIGSSTLAPATYDVMFSTTSSGTVTIRFGSQVNADVSTVAANSIMELSQDQ